MAENPALAAQAALDAAHQSQRELVACQKALAAFDFDLAEVHRQAAVMQFESAADALFKSYRQLEMLKRGAR